MNTEIDRTKNMIVYNEGYGLYFEHNNHDYSCFVMGWNKLEEFSGSFDLHKDIIDWINNSKDYEFGNDLKDYVESI